MKIKVRFESVGEPTFNSMESSMVCIFRCVHDIHSLEDARFFAEKLVGCGIELGTDIYTVDNTILNVSDDGLRIMCITSRTIEE